MLSTAAGASAPNDEATLVKEAVEGGVLAARIAAAQGRERAAGVAAPTLGNPVLEARHEQANGPAGASTDLLGGSIALAWGGVAEAQAATRREQAAEAWTRSEVVGGICAVRRSTLDLWLARERVRALEVAQARLERTLSTLGELARAGEVAPYDRDRLALAEAAHRHGLDAAKAAALDAEAQLAAWVGRPVAGAVSLLALPDAGPRAAAVEAAAASDPVLAALAREREAAERSLVAARRAGLPAVLLSGGARWDAYPDGSARTPGYELGAGLSLPVFDRNQVAVGTRRADLAEIDAKRVEREASVRASAEAAWQRAASLGPIAPPLATDALWQGAVDRYSAGESSIDALLAATADIEAAELASQQGAALRRSASLDLSCTIGVFPEPAIQAILEEHAR